MLIPALLIALTSPSAAQGADDESSAALISDRMRVHEKTAWMLRSMK